MAAMSLTGASATLHFTTVSTCSTPSKSPGPSSAAERAAASFASSSFVWPATLAPIEPEMSMPITSARLARRRSCFRSNVTGETSSMGVFA